MIRSIPAVMCALLAVNAGLFGCGGNGGGTPVTAAAGNSATPVSPGEFVYAVNTLGSSISQYQVATSGALTPLVPPTVNTGQHPVAVTTDAKGRYLYTANVQDGTISQFRIGANGALAPLSPAAVAAGAGSSGSGSTGVVVSGGPTALVEDSSERFLYVINSNENNLRVYAINTDGTLQPGRIVPNVSGPTFLAAHPLLPALYVGSDHLSQFQIGGDGALSPLSPATVTTPTGPTVLTVTPNGKFAYLGFTGSTTPAQYQVNADGSLSVLDLANSNIAADAGTPSLPNVDPGSRFTYSLALGSAGAQILQSRIGPDGRLTPLTPPTLQLGLTEITTLAFDSSGQFLYVPGPLSNSLLGLRIGSDGTLATLPVSAVAAGSVPITAIGARSAARRRAMLSAYGTHAFVTVRQRPL